MKMAMIETLIHLKPDTRTTMKTLIMILLAKNFQLKKVLTHMQMDLNLLILI